MSSWVGPIPPVVKMYVNFFLISLTVLIIVFSTSGIILTSSSLTPILFNQLEIFKTLSLRTVESEISISLERVQKKYMNLEIGSYPFFKQGKIGVSLVIRSDKKKLISKCLADIIKFVKKKKIKIITNK